MAAAANLSGCEVEVPAVAGLARQFNHRRLNLRVAVERTSLILQVSDDPVRKPIRDLEKPMVASSAAERNGGLEQMPGAVKLVAPDQVRPATFCRIVLDVRVQISIRFLSSLDQVERKLEEHLVAVLPPPARFPADRFQCFVKIGIREQHALEGAACFSGCVPKVIQHARRLEIFDAMCNGRFAAAHLPRAKETGLAEVHGAERQGTQQAMGRRRDGAGSRCCWRAWH